MFNARTVSSPEEAGSNARLIRLHCDWLRRRGSTMQTIYHRRANLERVAAHLPVPLIDASPEHLETWQSGLNISVSSIATYTNHVVGFYRWAVEAGHLDVNPSTRLPRPKVPARSARPIPETDLILALTCADEPIRTWLILAAFMGLRAGEIAAIRREDVAEVEGRMILSGVGKGQKPFRLIVPREVAPILAAHLNGRGPLWRIEPTGRPIRPINVTNAVSRFFRGLGMPYTLHWCRHRFGSQFYSATKDILLTQDVMRHANPATTRLYVATTRSEATAAMDRLAAGLAARSHLAGKRKRRPFEGEVA